MNKTFLSIITIFSFFSLSAQPAAAFCGFYVAKADASLFNNASQVVLARHDNKTGSFAFGGSTDRWVLHPIIGEPANNWVYNRL